MSSQNTENTEEKIIRQVLDVTGEVKNLHKVTTVNVFDNRWRVNIWCWFYHPETLSETRSYTIDYSYFIKVDESGKILDSSPSLGKKCSKDYKTNKLPTRG